LKYIEAFKPAVRLKYRYDTIW